MAQVADSIKQTILRYVEELERQNVRIQRAILFGSYAKGTDNKWSDIDVALVSPNFDGDRFDDRKKIARVTLDVDYHISPLPFRPEDFDPTNLFVKHIIETGIQIV